MTTDIIRHLASIICTLIVAHCPQLEHFSLFNITPHVADLVRHLNWIEVNMATNLSQDELINQLVQSDNRIEEYPNWRVNCQMFNSLTSSSSFTVLQV